MTNDANNYLTGTVAEKVADEVRKSVAASAGTQAADQLLLGFSTVHDRTVQAVDGAGQLADGSDQLRSGLGTAQQGTSRLADGAHQLHHGQNELLAGSGQLADGTQQLADGAGGQSGVGDDGVGDREGSDVGEADDAPLRAVRDDDDLAGVEDGLDADGEGHAGDLADVVAEEARVGEDGVVREGLDARAAREGRAGLVERDVAVLADPTEEELDPAVGLDLLLVGFALADEVLGVAVEDVDLLRGYIDCAKEAYASQKT